MKTCAFCGKQPQVEWQVFPYGQYDENEVNREMASCPDSECPAGQGWVEVEQWERRAGEPRVEPLKWVGQVNGLFGARHQRGQGAK